MSVTTPVAESPSADRMRDAAFDVIRGRSRPSRRGCSGRQLSMRSLTSSSLLGDPTRVRLVDALTHGERCVCDLAALVGLSESAVSHQLRLLRAARLVRVRRAGRLAFYSLDDHHVVGLVARHAKTRRGARVSEACCGGTCERPLGAGAMPGVRDSAARPRCMSLAGALIAAGDGGRVLGFRRQQRSPSLSAMAARPDYRHTVAARGHVARERASSTSTC